MPGDGPLRTNMDGAPQPNSGATPSGADGRSARRVPELHPDEVQPQLLPSMLAEVLPYDGEGPAKRFFGQLEDAARVGGIKEATLAILTRNRLRGAAARYVENTPGLSQTEDYGYLRDAILGRFATQESEAAAEKRLSACVQKGSERVTEYCDRLKALGNTLLGAILNTGPLSETQRAHEKESFRARLLRKFISGLRTDLRVPVARANPATMTDAIAVAIREENIIGVGGSSTAAGIFSMSNLREAINQAMDEMAATTPVQYPALAQPSSTLRPGAAQEIRAALQGLPVCNNHQVLGNISRDCPQGSNQSTSSNGNRNHNGYGRSHDGHRGSQGHGWDLDSDARYRYLEPGHIAMHHPAVSPASALPVSPGGAPDGQGLAASWQ